MKRIRFSRTALTDYAWRRGDLSWMLRPNGQTWLHNFILKCEAGVSPEDVASPVVINAHRRLGKSFLFVLLAFQDAMSRPGMQVKFISGEYEHLESFIVPLVDDILLTCPEHLMPRRSGYQWKVRMPDWAPREYSLLKMVAANFRRGNKARGPACDRAYMDEVREIDELNYFVESVLGVQFAGRDHPRFVMASTPPDSMDHDFTRPATGFIPRAMEKARYICVRGSENPDFSEADKAMLRDIIPGGEASVAWRREVECELISDQESLIVPEFWHKKAEICVDSWPHPQAFTPYTVMDTGYDPDFTGIVFAFVDFEQQLLVFEREHFERRMTLRDIATTVKQIEEEIGYDRVERQTRRHADINERGLADLRSDYRLYFQPVRRHNPEASLARFRSRVQDLKIRIVKSGCPQLIYQLEHGIYNKNRSTFERSDTMGHWDLGQAAVYCNQVVAWSYKPFVDLPRRDPTTSFGRLGYSGPQASPNFVHQILGKKFR